MPLLIVNEDGDDGVVRSTRFFEACFKNYESDLANIGHMKSDLRMKLLRAAIILGLETREAVVTSPGAIKPLEDTVAHAMWLDMPPSEQIAASGYWHSPRVNFRERFQSIAYSANQSWQWATLFSEPLTLQSGVELHPLNSTTMLRRG